jgi:hypothetical protein
MYFLGGTKLKCIYYKKFSSKGLLACTGCMIENNAMERMLKKNVICCGGTEEVQGHFNQDNWCSDSYSNRAFLEYRPQTSSLYAADLL